MPNKRTGPDYLDQKMSKYNKKKQHEAQKKRMKKRNEEQHKKYMQKLQSK